MPQSIIWPNRTAAVNIKEKLREREETDNWPNSKGQPSNEVQHIISLEAVIGDPVSDGYFSILYNLNKGNVGR